MKKYAILLVLFLSSKAYADVPRGTPINVGNNDIRECYTIEQFKQLLILDENYNNEKNKNYELSKKVNLQVKQIDFLNQEIIDYKYNNDLLEKENTRLYTMWKTENKKRHEAEEKPSFSAFAGWGTASVLGVVSTVLLGIIIFK